jgi:hypothetical protein
MVAEEVAYFEVQLAGSDPDSESFFPQTNKGEVLSNLGSKQEDHPSSTTYYCSCQRPLCYQFFPTSALTTMQTLNMRSRYEEANSSTLGGTLLSGESNGPIGS